MLQKMVKVFLWLIQDKDYLDMVQEVYMKDIFLELPLPLKKMEVATQLK